MSSNTATNRMQDAVNNAEDKLSGAKAAAERKLNDASGAAKDAWSTAQSEADNATSKARSSAKDLYNSARGQAQDSVGLVPEFTTADYARFFAAGGGAAFLSHGALTPVDVVKTRLQLEPKGSKLGMVSMARTIVSSEGPAGLLTGLGPTAVGYLIQGGAKFCGFEYFKRAGVQLAGSREEAEKHRTLIYIGGASAAELIASTFLTPLEAARIRLVSQRGYATGLVGAVKRMASESGFRGFYAGYIPILLKQIPFTQAQFTINEYAHEFVKNNVSQRSIEAYGRSGDVGISLACGLAAGVGAAIASHPADTLLSKINKGGGGKGGAVSKLITLTGETGFMGLWAGLGPRILMQGGLICAQMAMYDQIKKAVSAPPSITIAKTETATSS